VALLTFTDTTGTSWEVFQVRRASAKEGAVTPGREAGWLAFSSGFERRRFAPVPDGWEQLPVPALEQLCREARPVQPRIAPAPPAPLSGSSAQVAEHPPADVAGSPAAEQAPNDPHPSLSAPDLKRIAEAHGREARKAGATAVAALLSLRTLLATHGVGAASESFRVARRCFLETFYFETERPVAGAANGVSED
jgi:hypothetical protein